MSYNLGLQARQHRKEILDAKKQKHSFDRTHVSGSRSVSHVQPPVDVTSSLPQKNTGVSITNKSQSPGYAEHTFQTRIDRRTSITGKQSTTTNSSGTSNANSYSLATPSSRLDKGKGIAIGTWSSVQNPHIGLRCSSAKNSSFSSPSFLVPPNSLLSHGSTLLEPTLPVNMISSGTVQRSKRKSNLHHQSRSSANTSQINIDIVRAKGFTQARKRCKDILDAKISKRRHTSNGNQSGQNINATRFDFSETHRFDFDAEDDDTNDNSRRGISTEYIDEGDPIYPCQSCGAMLWYSETLRGSGKGKSGSYTLCCKGGKISLPVFPKDPPELLMKLYTGNHPKSKHFLDNIRRYNTMFSFTSMGGRVDKEANKGRGPNVFRIQGENCHRLGGLVPVGDSPPIFSQMYIYDTTNEVEHRLNAVSKDNPSSSRKIQPLDKDLIKEIKEMLDACNPLVDTFRLARDRYEENPSESFKLKLIGTREKDGRTYCLPTAPEIAALVPGDIDYSFDKRDIIIESHSGDLQHISELHPQYLALQYPLIFAYAEDGYCVDIYHNNVEDLTTSKASKVTMRQFFAYMIQHRPHLQSLLLKSRKLFQQFLVDAYTMIESEKISYIRFNQGNLRSESYDRLVKAVNEGNTEATYLGQRVILPSSFTGSSRYMMQNYLDAMAICKKFGYPDLFITFTCNPKWPELVRVLADERLSPEDAGDYIARMFKMKLDRLMKTFKEDHLFGKVEAYVYTIEFQKRGLPHAHICLFLGADYKLPEPADIDRIISAEILDEETQPDLHKLVTDSMMHGPCGKANPNSPCMVETNSCSKNFPKEFIEHTTVDKDGYPVYRRRDNGRSVLKSNVPLDNSYVVPYNGTLLKMFQAHMNTEWCNQHGSIRYLFKYMNKGPDPVTAGVYDEEKDEIKDFFDARYLSACEADWRIYAFDIHERYPAVIRLPYHLEKQQNVVFDPDTFEECVLESQSVNSTKFLM
uniref:uncharacterized protein LOC122609383 n=1 Tax=Erigeron canadensis TaxID=72917 RepID=UPI001CB905DF|nr:uncharacterized protein LOC122609383 [Erigeron canadensis]